jgi:acyl-CoA thioester hydrolase
MSAPSDPIYASTDIDKRAGVSLAQLDQLPCVHREMIPHEYLDAYGHMNVKFYFQLWDRAAGGFMAYLGMDWQQGLKRGYGNWVLKQIVEYLNEVREGDSVAIFGRCLGRSPKRIHNMYWMVNETRGVISSTSEVLVTCANLNERRTAPYPNDVAEMMDKRLEAFEALDWDAPASGILKP